MAHYLEENGLTYLWSKIKSLVSGKLDKSDVQAYAKTGSGITVSKSVPSNAVFTDTNTWRPLGTGATDACAGNDSRLSNSRPASDVYSWAKASTKPSYTAKEVNALQGVSAGWGTSASLTRAVNNHFIVAVNGNVFVQVWFPASQIQICGISVGKLVCQGGTKTSETIDGVTYTRNGDTLTVSTAGNSSISIYTH